MTLDKARSYVIDRFIYIESCVDALIAEEIGARPERKEFVKEILLNTAIIPTSNKFKLIRHLIAINSWPSTNEIHFHRLLQIRNQFAHVPGKLHISANIITKDNEIERVEADQSFKLESLDGRGFLKAVDHGVALAEFKDHYAEVRRILHEIRDQKVEQGKGSDGDRTPR